MEPTFEEILQSSRKKEFMAYIAANPDKFEQLIALALSNNTAINWRAAFYLANCMSKNDVRIIGVINQLIDALDNEKKEGYNREVLRILLNLTLDDEQEGLLFDKCVSIWETINQIPSLRMMAFRFIIKTLKKYPEMIPEVEFFMDTQYIEPLSPGIRHSVTKEFQQLKKKHK